MLVRLIMLGDDDESGGVFIKPMHNTGARHPADTGKAIGAMCKQTMHQRGFITRGGGGMNGQPRRFIDDQKVGIFINNVQCHGHRFKLEWPDLWDCQAVMFTFANFLCCIGDG